MAVRARGSARKPTPAARAAEGGRGRRPSATNSLVAPGPTPPQGATHDDIAPIAAGIAHDLRNYLMAISIGTAHAMQALPHDDEARVHLERIRNAGRQLTNLAHKLVALARDRASARRRVDVGSVAMDTVELARGLMPKSHRISLSLEGAGLCVLADPTEVQQVILNLLVNARDAMPAGGLIRVGLSAQSGPGVGGSRSTVVRIDVADAGVGIPPAIRDRVYDPFFTTKGDGRGSGLGLSTVRAVVRALGGSIHMRSKVGAGTEFTVELPRIADPEAGRHIRRHDVHVRGARVW